MPRRRDCAYLTKWPRFDLDVVLNTLLQLIATGLGEGSSSLKNSHSVYTKKNSLLLNMQSRKRGDVSI